MTAEIFDHLLMRAPYTAVCIGASRSGKTTLVCDLVSRFNEVTHPDSIQENGPLKRVILVYRGNFQPVYREMIQKLDSSITVEQYNYIPIVEMESESFWQTEGRGQSLIIFDDGLNLFEDKHVAHIIEDGFVRKSHHCKISIIVNLQDAFRSKTPQLKTCRQNSSYVIIVRSQLCGPLSIMLQRELWPHKPGFLSKVFFLAFEQDKYWAIIYDQTISCPDKGRVRAGGLFKYDKHRMPTLYYDE